MKSYYDKRAVDPDFVVGQNIWVFTPKTYKRSSRKLLQNYHGPYRVVQKLSPVHNRLRTCSSKPVSSIVHANRMKHFIDPDQRPIDPPTVPPKKCIVLLLAIFHQIVLTPHENRVMQRGMQNQIILLQKNNRSRIKITQMLNQPN